MVFYSTDEIAKEELRFFTKYLAACPLNQPLEEALTYFLEMFHSKIRLARINQ